MLLNLLWSNGTQLCIGYKFEENDVSVISDYRYFSYDKAFFSLLYWLKVGFLQYEMLLVMRLIMLLW